VPKTKMKDMVVLLPGIMGSVLEKDGKPVWDTRIQALLTAVKSLRDGSPLEHLKLAGDDLKGGDIGDGIIATRLMPKVIVPIPKLPKSGGYSVILDKIAEEFDNVLPASKHETANLFEFPYDWRRDNRVSAHLLEKFVGERLKRWRESSKGAADAKVILIAHSMGGLVARYYLEVLGGWQDCKALITFGTPHRGAPSALEMLVNGKMKLGFTFDLTEVISSFTSIYQLLPIYEMVHVNGDWKRVAEINIPGIDRKRAEDALAFHRTIEEEQKINSEEKLYQGKYQTMPFFGIQQSTFQSADLSNGTLTLSSKLPPAIERIVGKNYGDGTVPHFSAVPIEFEKPPTQNSLSQTHGFLQSHPKSLDDLCEFIATLEGQNWSAIRDPETNKDEEEPLAISLSNLDDVYTADEPVELIARLTKSNVEHKGFKAIITPIQEDGSVKESLEIKYAFHQQNEHWVLTIPKLEPGLYQVEVRTGKTIRKLNPVHDLFQVIG